MVSIVDDTQSFALLHDLVGVVDTTKAINVALVENCGHATALRDHARELLLDVTVLVRIHRHFLD